MSVNLLEKPRIDERTTRPQRKRLNTRGTPKYVEYPEPKRLRPLPSFREDEETMMAIKYSIWMVILAFVPWILFYVLNFYYPDFLMIPITPN